MTDNPNVVLLEMACLGALMDNNRIASFFYERLPIEQFGSGTRILASTLFTMIQDQIETSPMQVVERLRVDGELNRCGGGPFVFDCWTHGQKVVDIHQEVETLGRLYLLRDAWGVGLRLQNAVAGMDVTEWVSYAQAQVDRIAKIEAGTMPPSLLYLSDVLDMGDVGVDWTIPGLLPSATTTMLTAEEGVGKSTLMRQVAVAAMCGIQPFVPSLTYEPQRTLLINCEGSLNQLTRGLRAVWSYAQVHAPKADTKYLAVESHPEGVNLSEPQDQAWLHRLVREHRPDLLIVSPLYRATDADLNTEEGVRSWQRALEPIVADGVALLMEHHAPNAKDGQLRGLRPIGSSAIRRWFGQGVSMRHRVCNVHQEAYCRSCVRQAQVELWRGSRDDEVAWPHYLKGEGGAVWWIRDNYAEVEGSKNVK